MSKKSKKSTKNIEVNSEPPYPITLDKSNNVSIQILAKPGAKENRITDISVDGVGVQINAPPTEGEANSELVKYISKVLNLKKNDVVLDRGFKSRQKVLKISNLSLEQVKNKILDEINNGIAAGCVYYTVDKGIWENSEKSTQLYENVVKNVSCLYNQYLSKNPAVLQISNTAHSVPAPSDLISSVPKYWNKGVEVTIREIGNLPDYTSKGFKKTKESIMNNPEIQKILQ